jgi:site-specific DNA-cytosine methylase
MDKLRVLGICAGAGVMVHPFKNNLVGNIEPRNDYNTPNDIQWRLNFGDIPLFKGNTVYPDFKHIDIIIGHPNCGHSSLLAYSRGKKLGNGKSDPTMFTFVESVKYYKPKVFMFENLTALFKSFPENEFNEAFSEYELKKYNVSMAKFGNSQVSRERLVVIGIRKGMKSIKSSNFKLPAIENISLKTCKELESNLKYPDYDLCHVRELDSKVVCMEKDFKKLNLKDIRYIWNLPENKKRKKWDATTTGKGRMKNLPGVYRNLANDYPLTARKQNRQFNSSGYIMSPRELARIQGLPDSFNIWFDIYKDQYSINKGRVSVTKCPPYELGKWFYDCIINSKLKPKSNGNQKKQVTAKSTVLPTGK